MVNQNGLKIIQAMAYNGLRTVYSNSKANFNLLTNKKVLFIKKHELSHFAMVVLFPTNGWPLDGAILE